MHEHIKKLMMSTALWALVPALYLGAWHWSTSAGSEWPGIFNIPGLMILALAWPWSTNALELVFFHGSAVGSAGSLLIHAAVIFGFGLNLSLLSALARHVGKRLTTRPGPAAAPPP
jgi:hypothetical protein